jgi:hypothetical protein
VQIQDAIHFLSGTVDIIGPERQPGSREFCRIKGLIRKKYLGKNVRFSPGRIYIDNA